jgi:LacI family transcriptional regulator
MRTRSRPARSAAASVRCTGSKSSKRSRPTLSDLARDLGLHVSTISRALDPRSPHAVSPALADKIRRASQRRGYRRNIAGYLLRTNRSHAVGVVIPDITDPVFPPIIRGIEDGLAQHDYVAIVANTDGEARRQAQIIETMRPRGVDGLILASVTRKDRPVSQIAKAIPVMTISRQIDDQRFSSVVHDEENGIDQVLTHLASLGHRRIAAIAGPQTVSTGFKRYRSFVRHSTALGLDLERLPVAFARTFNELEGERCAEELLGSGSSSFTAVVCANDRLAVGAITGFRRHGIDCPEDVSVTGFNDMILVDRLSPALTTVRVQHYKAGVEAARLIVDLIEGAVSQPRHVMLPVDLIVRDSARSLLETAEERR